MGKFEFLVLNFFIIYHWLWLRFVFIFIKMGFLVLKINISKAQ